jgi:hypothetical protein
MSIILAALAATWSQSPQCNGQDIPNVNPATLEYLRRIDTPSSALTTGRTTGYARIVAEYQPCQVTDSYRRRYEPERRDIVRRFFMGKQVSKILTAKVSVRPLGVSGLTTLMSIARDSGKEGEKWATAVGNSLTILPYFRIEPNMTLNLEASYLSNRTYASSVASDTLNLLDRATKLITPATPLITTSNKARFNDASTFVDTTINGLLRVEIKEDLRANAWLGPDKETVLAELVLVATGTNDPYARNSFEVPRPVGKWIIKAQVLEGSLFSGTGTAPSAASILNFQVTDGKRVREMLAGDTIITTARAAVDKASADAKKAPAAALCRALASRADAEGFSTTDVNWIVAAYIAEMAPIPDKAVSAGCAFASVAKIYAEEAGAKM